MKNLTKLIVSLVCLFGSLAAMAQNFDPYKGTFVKETDKAYFEANIDLRNKTIEGQGEETGMCYGTITITNARGIDGFDIVGADSLDGGEPNIWVVPWMFPDMGPIRVGLDYDARAKTITLTDWDGGVYFNGLTLKKQ